MPQSFGTRSERRAFSRDASRYFATTQLLQPKAVGNLGPKRTNRAERRKQGRRGDISALVHGKHDTAWLYSGTLNASGQQRINHKRAQRAEYWKTFAIRQHRRNHGVRTLNEARAEYGLSPFAASYLRISR